MRDWVTLRGERFLGLGSHSNLQLLSSSNLFDITPIIATQTLPNDGITIAAGIATLTFTSAHGLEIGSRVEITGATNIGGTDINGEYVIATVPHNYYSYIRYWECWPSQVQGVEVQ